MLCVEYDAMLFEEEDEEKEIRASCGCGVTLLVMYPCICC
jgi:hypothetical protein